jgi:hypothetical protein
MPSQKTPAAGPEKPASGEEALTAEVTTPNSRAGPVEKKQVIARWRADVIDLCLSEQATVRQFQLLGLSNRAEAARAARLSCDAILADPHWRRLALGRGAE